MSASLPPRFEWRFHSFRKSWNLNYGIVMDSTDLLMKLPLPPKPVVMLFLHLRRRARKVGNFVFFSGPRDKGRSVYRLFPSVPGPDQRFPIRSGSGPAWWKDVTRRVGTLPASLQRLYSWSCRVGGTKHSSRRSCSTP